MYLPDEIIWTNYFIEAIALILTVIELVSSLDEGCIFFLLKEMERMCEGIYSSDEDLFYVC